MGVFVPHFIYFQWILLMRYWYIVVMLLCNYGMMTYTKDLGCKYCWEVNKYISNRQRACLYFALLWFVFWIFSNSYTSIFFYSYPIFNIVFFSSSLKCQWYNKTGQIYMCHLKTNHTQALINCFFFFLLFLGGGDIMYIDLLHPR